MWAGTNSQSQNLYGVATPGAWPKKKCIYFALLNNLCEIGGKKLRPFFVVANVGRTAMGPAAGMGTLNVNLGPTVLTRGAGSPWFCHAKRQVVAESLVLATILLKHPTPPPLLRPLHFLWGEALRLERGPSSDPRHNSLALANPVVRWAGSTRAERVPPSTREAPLVLTLIVSSGCQNYYPAFSKPCP